MKQKRTYPDPLINLAEVSRTLSGTRNDINAVRIPARHVEAVDALNKAVTNWKKTHKPAK